MSDYAHGQHLVWVEGRFKRSEGQLYLTLVDPNGRQLEQSGFRPVDHSAQLDGEWWVFDHKLIEDTWERVDIDQGAIVFELRKPGEQAPGQGKLEIPMRKPPVIAGPQAGARAEAGAGAERAGDDTRLPPGVAAEQVAARAWSPGGEVLAYFLQNQDTAAEGSIYLWRPGQAPREVAPEWRVTGFQWSPDGRYVLLDAGSSATRSGLLIEVESQKVIERFSFVGKAYWSDESSRLLVARPRPVTPPPAWEVEGTLDVAAYNPQTRKWFVFVRGSHDYYLQPTGWDDRGYPVFEKVAFSQPGRRTTISVEEIVANHLPRPFDPEVLPHGLKYPGRWAANVMPGLLQEIAQMGWRELPAEQMGALRFFTKEVAGVQVKIGVLPVETGGPTEDRATTTVAVELWPVE
ncbi:MAG: hypothetical protein D9V47_01875 [Clostridia bacterium]|nr:MAG: hypothetical protein D9V47_01875 [Clostridia bacterium]